MYVFDLGGVGGEGCEWMRELGLGFTNPVGITLLEVITIICFSYI